MGYQWVTRMQSFAKQNTEKNKEPENILWLFILLNMTYINDCFYNTGIKNVATIATIKHLIVSNNINGVNPQPIAVK